MSAPNSRPSVWQQERFERFVKALDVEADTLDDRERRFLMWLASWDYDVEAGFLAVLLGRLRGEYEGYRASLLGEVDHAWTLIHEAEKERADLVDRLKVIRRAATVPGVTTDD